MSLRAKLLGVFLSLIAAALIATAIVVVLAAQAGLSGVAARVMSARAEELRKQMDNQWQILQDNDLADRPEFVQAYVESIRSYAGTVLSSGENLVLALEEDGSIAFWVGGVNSSFTATEEEQRDLAAIPRTTGWLERRVGDTDHVGYGFLFGPLSWYVTITDSADAFFEPVRTIALRLVIVFVVALAGTTAAVFVVSRYVAQPLQVVSRAMDLVVQTGNLHARVAVTSDDETGETAKSFNAMVERLEANQAELEETARNERKARLEVSDREFEMLKLLGHMAEFKDSETAAHVERVGHYSRLLAVGIGESEERQDLIFRASALHDVGKFAVPDEILQKPGLLEPEEYEIVKTHAQAGYDLLADSRSVYLQTGAIIALTHHERWDGLGYPNGIAGDEIPLVGRIAAIVDVFDALVSKRPYKEAWMFESAIEWIEGESGTRFDPDIVAVFLDSLDQVRAIHAEHPDGDRGES